MSIGAEEFVVDGQLAEWLDRHGMHARTGDRVRLEIVSDPVDIEHDEVWAGFVGRFESPEPGMARRAKDIVRDEMGA
jgi:hypothetical protein